MNHAKKKVCNWGLYPIREAQNFRVQTNQDCQKLLKQCDQLTPRGLGRSYGDASLGENLLLPEGRQYFLDFDATTGLLHAQAGVSLDEILRVFVPKGFFLPVSPGTRKVTLGGAVAADVHGKNHHKDGSFCDHVEFVDLLLENGDCIRASKSSHSELFWATAGGMGLTGFILTVGVRLLPIESSWIRQKAVQAADFEELVQLFLENEDCTYTVAWIDCAATGSSLGRGVFLSGEHAKFDESSEVVRLQTHSQREIEVPFFFPHWALNSLSIRLFNVLYYHKQIFPIQESLVHYSPFFHPLDVLSNWNRIYGRRGFLQYQFVVPLEGGEKVMRRIIEKIAASGFGSFLAVLKLFGESSKGYLSFPKRGYTLALDFPNCSETLKLMDELDELVVEAGGRFYLAKDARMKPKTFLAGYSEQLREFNLVLDQYSPRRMFRSDLALRLGIIHESFQ